MTSFVLENFLPYQLVILGARISDEFSRRYRCKFGISIPEWRIVAHLSQAEKVSIREIYQKVGMDKSKTSRAAARLVKAGHVTKKTNPADRRLVELSLTKKGRAMMDEIGPLALAFEAEALACLPTDQRRIFLTSVKTLLEQYP